MLLTRAITRYERRAACTAIAATRRQHSRHGHVSPGSHNHRYFISHYKQFTTRDFWPAETPVLRFDMLKYPESRPISGIWACQTAERLFRHAKNGACARSPGHARWRNAPKARGGLTHEACMRLLARVGGRVGGAAGGRCGATIRLARLIGVVRLAGVARLVGLALRHAVALGVG